MYFIFRTLCYWREEYAPSKLARCFIPGRAPMLLQLRPSNEALLRARVPGAQDQRGCSPVPSPFSTFL